MHSVKYIPSFIHEAKEKLNPMQAAVDLSNKHLDDLFKSDRVRKVSVGR